MWCYVGWRWGKISHYLIKNRQVDDFKPNDLTVRTRRSLICTEYTKSLIVTFSLCSLLLRLLGKYCHLCYQKHASISCLPRGKSQYDQTRHSSLSKKQARDQNLGYQAVGISELREETRNLHRKSQNSMWDPL